MYAGVGEREYMDMLHNAPLPRHKCAVVRRSPTTARPRPSPCPRVPRCCRALTPRPATPRAAAYPHRRLAARRHCPDGTAPGRTAPRRDGTEGSAAGGLPQLSCCGSSASAPPPSFPPPLPPSPQPHTCFPAPYYHTEAGSPRITEAAGDI